MSDVPDPQTPSEIGARARRVRIIDAMVQSCAEKTYAETTISDIVAHASISRTTFYKHFDDKRACFDASLDACVEEIQAVARAAHTPADPPAEAVPKATAAILERMAEKPALAQLLSGEALAVEPAVVTRYRRLLLPAVAGLWDAAGEPQRPHIDPRLAFGRAQLLVFSKVAAGDATRLTDLIPELVYLAVAPFAGHEEALVQVRHAEEQRAPERSLGR